MLTYKVLEQGSFAWPKVQDGVMRLSRAQQKALEHAKFEASVERAARQHEQAVVAEKEAFITELKELIEKLEGETVQNFVPWRGNPQRWSRNFGPVDRLWLVNEGPTRRWQNRSAIPLSSRPRLPLKRSAKN